MEAHQWRVIFYHQPKCSTPQALKNKNLEKKGLAMAAQPRSAAAIES